MFFVSLDIQYIFVCRSNIEDKFNVYDYLKEEGNTIPIIQKIIMIMSILKCLFIYSIDNISLIPDELKKQRIYQNHFKKLKN